MVLKKVTVLIIFILLTVPVISGSQEKVFNQITIEIEVARQSGNGKDWDRIWGSSPAPDIYGKIDFAEGSCDIPLNEDRYILRHTCKADVKIGDKINIQIYDKDRGRQDEVVGIGTVEFKENPMTATVGSMKVIISAN